MTRRQRTLRRGAEIPNTLGRGTGPVTRLCLVGSPDVTLKYELLSRETARDALATYDLDEPFENTIALDTVSVGAAVALLNDLNWYLVRFVNTALVREPSISEEEWLSRGLAEAVRNDEIDPAETGTYLKVYGVETGADGEATDANEGKRAGSDDDTAGAETGESSGDAGAVQSPRTERGTLVEPLYVRRTDGEVPEYDLRDVDETAVVRVTESEFQA